MDFHRLVLQYEMIVHSSDLDRFRIPRERIRELRRGARCHFFEEVYVPTMRDNRQPFRNSGTEASRMIIVRANPAYPGRKVSIAIDGKRQSVAFRGCEVQDLPVAFFAQVAQLRRGIERRPYD